MRAFYAGPPLAELHEEYAKKGLLDQEAQLMSSSSVTIDAPDHVVWRLIIDMPNWPTWRTDARVTEIGAIEEDACFRYIIRGAPINATFAVIIPDRELTFTGVAMRWMKAIDRIQLAPDGDGRTLASIEESLSGPLINVFYSEARLRSGHQKMLRMLKAAAETSPW